MRFRLLLFLAALSSCGVDPDDSTVQSPVDTDEYYMALLSYQPDGVWDNELPDIFNKGTKTHTWGVWGRFQRVGERLVKVEDLTISWLPIANEGEVVQGPVPARLYSHETSLEYGSPSRNRILRRWGPFQVTREKWERAKRHHRKLETYAALGARNVIEAASLGKRIASPSGRLYQSDREHRFAYARPGLYYSKIDVNREFVFNEEPIADINCFHAVSDMFGTGAHDMVLNLTSRGFEATREVLLYFMKQGVNRYFVRFPRDAAEYDAMHARNRAVAEHWRIASVPTAPRLVFPKASDYDPTLPLDPENPDAGKTATLNVKFNRRGLGEGQIKLLVPRPVAATRIVAPPECGRILASVKGVVRYGALGRPVDTIDPFIGPDGTISWGGARLAGFVLSFQATQGGFECRGIQVTNE